MPPAFSDLPGDQLDRLYALERSEAVARAREGILAFTLHVMPAYRVSWHHVVMARALNRFERGEAKRLIITCPPRAGKSQLVSRHLPGYILGRNPNAEIIAVSYGASLAQSMSRDVQRVMTDTLYTDIFPDTVLPGKGSVAVGYARTADRFDVMGYRGRYQASGLGGSVTGKGADFGIIDDFLRNAQDAASPTIRDRQWEWYTSTFYTRLSKVGRVCITATRWHADDLVGRLLRQAESDPEADQWEVINLPAIAEGELHPDDPRAIGEALWPERYPLPALLKTKAQSERVWVSLYQGRPSPPEGGVFKRQWWKFYRKAELPLKFDVMILSCDTTQKDKEKNDYNCYLAIAAVGANRYVIGHRKFKAAFTVQVRKFRDLADRFPDARRKCVEDTAAGTSLIDHLKNEIPGIVAVTPKGSKLARAEAVSPQVEAGNVWLPHPDDEPWVKDFLQEHTDFPNGANDDQVDALTMGLAQLEKKKISTGFPVYSETKRSEWTI